MTKKKTKSASKAPATLRGQAEARVATTRAEIAAMPVEERADPGP